ncbi:hypothetical protein [Streptomyces otsuchiensis]|uniref:hypothetical protein n=1 Tax=Streptomyces otsuchiensis TaxID=2681388 RepID=UPI0010322AB6|nr:hypothetical protein [Streptomyces otsuchiensis]
MRAHLRTALTAIAVSGALLILPACSSGDGLNHFGQAPQADDKAKEPGSDGEGESEEPAAEPGGEPSAWELYEAGADEFANAQSMRLVGTVPNGASLMDMDIHLDLDGDCVADMTMADEGSVEIRKSGDDIWMKGDQLFWETAGSAEVGRLLGGMYLYGTTDNPDMSSFAGLCELSELIGGIPLDNLTGTAVETGRDDQNGVAVVDIEVTEDNGDVGRFRIAAEQPHHILRVGVVEDGEDLVLDFDDYNVPVDVTPPDDADVLDYEELSP